MKIRLSYHHLHKYLCKNENFIKYCENHNIKLRDQTPLYFLDEEGVLITNKTKVCSRPSNKKYPGRKIYYIESNDKSDLIETLVEIINEKNSPRKILQIID